MKDDCRSCMLLQRLLGDCYTSLEYLRAGEGSAAQRPRGGNDPMISYIHESRVSRLRGQLDDRDAEIECLRTGAAGVARLIRDRDGVDIDDKILMWLGILAGESDLGETR